MRQTQAKVDFVLCIENRHCDDLVLGKAYRVLPDAAAMRDGYIRVLDESGEDYLYPEAYFVPVDLPAKARAALGADS